MTLDEIAGLLPNGFHDAQVRSIALDFVSRSAILELETWVGSMDASVGAGREKYRRASLELRGFTYFVIDPPDLKYPYAARGPVTVDLCEPEESGRLPAPRAGEFSARFFVASWNAFISISAEAAELRWIVTP
jgi:hypothetical protein